MPPGIVNSSEGSGSDERLRLGVLWGAEESSVSSAFASTAPPLPSTRRTRVERRAMLIGLYLDPQPLAGGHRQDERIFVAGRIDPAIEDDGGDGPGAAKPPDRPARESRDTWKRPAAPAIRHRGRACRRPVTQTQHRARDSRRDQVGAEWRIQGGRGES